MSPKPQWLLQQRLSGAHVVALRDTVISEVTDYIPILRERETSSRMLVSLDPMASIAKSRIGYLPSLGNMIEKQMMLTCKMEFELGQI